MLRRLRATRPLPIIFGHRLVIDLAPVCHPYDQDHERALFDPAYGAVVTDTIPLTKAGKKSPKIRQLSVAELMGETMRRIALNESVSSLYVD